MLLALTGTLTACAQTPVPAEAAASASLSAPEPAPAASAPRPSGQTPAFTESNFGLAFNYIDANRDGQISREEAARFRGVAKHFDAADTNHDGVLSRQEFDEAMRRSLGK